MPKNKPKRDHKFVVCVTKEQHEELSKKHFAEAITRNNLKFTISEFIVEKLFSPEPEVIPEPEQMPTPKPTWKGYKP